MKRHLKAGGYILLLMFASLCISTMLLSASNKYSIAHASSESEFSCYKIQVEITNGFQCYQYCEHNGESFTVSVPCFQQVPITIEKVK